MPVVPVVPVVPEPAMEGPPEGAAPGLEVDQVGSQPSSHWTTVEPLYCGHLGDLVKCPVERGVLISESIFGT